MDSSRGLRFAQIDYASEVQMPLHTHEDAASLDFCLSGTIQEIRDHNTFAHNPSSLSLMPIGVPHANCFPKGVSTFLVVLKAHWIEQFRPIFPLIDSPLCCRTGRPTWIAARMYREFQRQDDLSALTLEGMLLELLAEMARSTVSPFEKGAPLWLRQATDFLQTHFTQSLSTEVIAATVGVHPAHLMRGFHQHHHCTIGEYVRRLRVEYACHLLSASRTSLGQVAYEAGFSDQSHFSRTFKQHMNMSPKEFQKECGNASTRLKMQF